MDANWTLIQLHHLFFIIFISFFFSSHQISRVSLHTLISSCFHHFWFRLISFPVMWFSFYIWVYVYIIYVRIPENPKWFYKYTRTRFCFPLFFFHAYLLISCLINIIHIAIFILVNMLQSYSVYISAVLSTIF